MLFALLAGGNGSMNVEALAVIPILAAAGLEAWALGGPTAGGAWARAAMATRAKKAWKHAAKG
eukprot:13084768-Alexandrium_andersonii.AAC.1